VSERKKKRSAVDIRRDVLWDAAMGRVLAAIEQEKRALSMQLASVAREASSLLDAQARFNGVAEMVKEMQETGRLVRKTGWKSSKETS